MMGRGGTIRAWLELMRLSNLPTCLSNVLVGCALGARGDSIAWTTMAHLTAAIVLMYVGGMMLNDVADAARDRVHRPDRPIPSGRVSRRAALVASAGALALGTLLAGLRGPQALVLALILAAVIVAYDLLHQRTEVSAILMGLCRALVYLVAAAAISWPLETSRVVWMSGAIGGYVALLTVLAAVEGGREGDGRRLAVPVLLLIVLVPAAVIQPQRWILAGAIGLLLALWLGRSAACYLRRPQQVRAAVQGWLSGICLVDGFYLSLLDRPAWAGVAIACFIVTMLGHRVILGT